MATYTELLKKVEQQASNYGETMQPPATEVMLNKLIEDSTKELQTTVPSDYLAFLRIMNGLDWNGMSIYACTDAVSADSSHARISGLIEANLNHRDIDVMQDFLVLGEDSMDVYVYDPKSKKYQARDRTAFDINETFNSFDDLVAWALQKHLM